MDSDLQLRFFYPLIAQKSKITFLLDKVAEVFFVDKWDDGLWVGKEQSGIGVLECLNCQEIVATCAVYLLLRTNSQYIIMFTLISKRLVRNFLCCK